MVGGEMDDVPEVPMPWDPRPDRVMRVPTCRGKSRRTGDRCRNPVVTGREYCRFHGGQVRIGKANPAYRHGRYSKYVPAKLRERYEEALEDPQLLALRDELALMDVRIQDLLERVGKGESGQLWAELTKAVEELREATRHQKPLDHDSTMRLFDAQGRVYSLVRSGAKEYERWADMLRAIGERRKLAESERRRWVEMRQVMTVEQVVVGLQMLFDLLSDYLEDSDARLRVLESAARLFSVDVKLLTGELQPFNGKVARNGN